MALVVAMGSVTKSSLFAALGPFLIYIGLLIRSGIISAFPGQAWMLTYLSGSGNSGYLISSSTSSVLPTTTSIPVGTDGIAAMLSNFVLYPSYYVAFTKTLGSASVQPSFTIEPFSFVLLTAVGLAFGYAFLFLFIGWFTFWRAQISE